MKPRPLISSRAPAKLALSTIVACSLSMYAQATPFDPNRAALYSQKELWDGFDYAKCNTSTPNAVNCGWDAATYADFIASGKFRVALTLAQMRATHDAGITTALDIYLDAERKAGKKIVGIMGSGSEAKRCKPAYRATARLAWSLTRSGYLVVSGGGPGMMEAANLGAYLSPGDIQNIDKAIEIMSRKKKPSGDPTDCTYASDADYVQASIDVINDTQLKGGGESVGVPTWFYGNEPPNVFATRVAKYFSNGIREEMLLAVSQNGVIFVEGSAGTRQEIFQNASIDHYGSFCYVSPMVFFGLDHAPLYGFLESVASTSPVKPSSPGFDQYITIVDVSIDKLGDDTSLARVISFLEANKPKRVDDGAGGVCKNMPIP